MSLITIDRLEHSSSVLALHIYDIRQEMICVEEKISELTNDLTFYQQKLTTLHNKMNEKKNMLQTLNSVKNFRNTQIKNENVIKEKVQYVQRCMDYLNTYSQHIYIDEVYMMDEVIEYAHKLHFIRLIQEWMLLHACYDIKYPNNEQEFHRFEILYFNDENYIYLSESNPKYMITFHDWTSIYEYQNAIGFLITSSVFIIDSMIKKETIM